jgi:hypothetical protein
MAKKKETMQTYIGQLLNDATSFARTAYQDITNRADRVDALDSIMLAKKKLAQAEEAIKSTMVFK